MRFCGDSKLKESCSFLQFRIYILQAAFEVLNELSFMSFCRERTTQEAENCLKNISISSSGMAWTASAGAEPIALSRT